ncbi:7614_t:CDS:2, partial [Scutellospora calospora]
SNWNMYIQKIKTPRKGIQLGVYLHRHSMPDPTSPCGNNGNSSSIMNVSPLNKSPTSSPGADDRFTTSTRQSMLLKNNNEKSFSRYADKRKTVRTWFKIFCPSRGPSHGWRSSSLCQDDYLLDVRDYDTTASAMSNSASSTLKFSVVMGH